MFTEKLKKLKEKWKFYPKLRKKMFLICLIISISEIVLIILLNISGLLCLKPEDFKWFLSASSQSMAALFGLIGMFIIFKVEIISNKLNSCYEIIRKKFETGYWTDVLGRDNPKAWHDNEVLVKATHYLDSKKDISTNIKNDIECSIAETSSLIKSKEKIVKEFKIPLLFIVSSLLISLVLIPLSEFIFKLKFPFLILFLPFISINIIMIYFYFKGILYLAKT
ncbi:MAG: hypothetical protein ACTSQG_11500 [Promethearchaeota archaeon]